MVCFNQDLEPESILARHLVHGATANSSDIQIQTLFDTTARLV